MPERKHPETFTEADWNDLDHTMVWSIRDKDSVARFERESFPEETDDAFWFRYNRVELDLTAPGRVADGVYEVQFNYLHLTGIGQSTIVRDGRFEPRAAADAALQAVCRALKTTPNNLDHVFIERWRHEPETGRLIVSLRS